MLPMRRIHISDWFGTGSKLSDEVILMKKLCLFAVLIFLLNSLTAFAYDDIKLIINGNEIQSDVSPVIFNSRTLVPARAVLEELGADVSWVPTEKKAVISEHSCEIIMYANQDFATVNGENITLDCPAMLINGRIMIPVRFVAETLGADVSWDSAALRVIINKEMNRITLRSINAVESGDYLNVTATFDGNVAGFSDFKLTNDGKNRIVIDVEGAAVGDVGTLSVENSNVLRVRCGQFKTSPFVTRIVADLDNMSEYSVESSENTITVKIKNVKTAVVPQTPQTPQAPSASVSWDGSVKLNDNAKDILVVIDPGHGGSETGAIANKGTQNQVFEKDINLAISLYLNEMLRSAGVKTAMTRTDDSYVSLNDRPVFANHLGAELFLSVHSNSFNNDIAEGTEVLYFKNGGSSYGISGEEFARLLQQELVSALGTFDRGITDGSEMYVIKHTSMPAVIAEIAFVSNPDDLAKLTSEQYQKKAAYALCRATIKAINIISEKKG